ncbi:MAG: tRNA pseudouridine(55) synthase TruB [Bacteroidales bacterium]|nr:tRNA pseudouridine(55) synthase TruB [Bacteroidales bacterium]
MKNSNGAFHFKEGEVLLIDKPLEWTSFDVVNKIRGTITRKAGIRGIKVGHAGTLDPLATGLLILCTGKFTKRISEMMGLEKEYTGTMMLGSTTPSFDLETEIDEKYPTDHLTQEAVYEAVFDFIGDIEQVPPLFSAIKVKGNRAYHFARNSEKVNLSPRNVTIETFELTRIAIPEVDFRVVCSKGTYIRSLVRDFGKKLNSGAHLTSLRRTRIGKFSIDHAITPMQFEKMLENFSPEVNEDREL